MEEIGIIIPAYNPDSKLVEIVKKLNKNKFGIIIVIDDGSRKESEEYFKEIQNVCTILKNDKNEGKGNALKKGFSYVLQNKLKLISVITVDADGQHDIEDVLKLTNKVFESNTSICLGQRDFKSKQQVPISRKIGNRISSICLKIRTKYYLEDTQTGLRAIPTMYLQEFENIKGGRYEYEINMLKYCIKRKININTIPIKTIYEENQSTSFKTIKDSLSVLYEIIR